MGRRAVSKRGADLLRARLETTAAATLAAIGKAIVALIGEGEVALSVDGVKTVDAFDGQFVLVVIHAIAWTVDHRPRGGCGR